MHERLRQRVDELRRDLEIGQTRLREIEAQQIQLRETLLRITGAIQVLEEMLAPSSDDGQDDSQSIETVDSPRPAREMGQTPA